MIKIDKGIPVPEVRGSPRRLRYPWHEMEVGDSFLHPSRAGIRPPPRLIQNGREFQLAKEGAGTRVWRIK